MAHLRVYNSAGRGLDMSDAGKGTFYFGAGISDARYTGESQHDLDTYVWHYRDPSSSVARDFSVFVSFPSAYEVVVENVQITDRQGRPTLDLFGAGVVMAYEDLISNAPEWTFDPFGGPDTLVGNRYADILQGGNRSDTLHGRLGADRLYGERGNDFLNGNGGNDRLFGGPGADVLDGGKGRDLLAGGGGADTFVFATPSSAGIGRARDHILDFDRTSDLIDLGTIDANERRHGDQAFDFIGGRPFHEKAGELHFRSEILSGDTDGDGRPDFQILVDDIGQLRAVDLIL